MYIISYSDSNAFNIICRMTCFIEFRNEKEETNPNRLVFHRVTSITSDGLSSGMRLPFDGI